jgi:hypothetical protein
VSIREDATVTPATIVTLSICPATCAFDR